MIVVAGPFSRAVCSGLACTILMAGCDAHPEVATITIEPSAITLVENDRTEVRAIARDAAGHEISGVTMDWTSRDFSVAIVAPQSGELFAAAPGSTFIEARAGGIIAVASVTVTPGVVKILRVAPSRFAIVPGQQVQLYVEAQDARGLTLRNRAMTFAQATPRIATVTTQGLVTGVSPGMASISVTAGGASETVHVRVSEQSLSFEFYKRGGTTTPGTATLTFAPEDISRATLAIDGRTLSVGTITDWGTGLLCIGSLVPPLPLPGSGAITRCAYQWEPFTIRLCTPVGSDPNDVVLQYVLLPAADTARVTATSAELLAALQANTKWQGIAVHSACASGFLPPNTTTLPRWIRNAPDTNYFLWPDVTTVRSAASVAAMLDGAVIYKVPGTTLDFSRYVAIRLTPFLEVWH